MLKRVWIDRSDRLSEVFGELEHEERELTQYVDVSPHMMLYTNKNVSNLGAMNIICNY